MEKAFLTATEVSKIINLGRTKTYELMRSGRIPKVVIEGCLRVPATALQEWIAERSVAVTALPPQEPVRSEQEARTASSASRTSRRSKSR